MLARQRQSLILEHLGRAGGVRVSDLVQILGVSDMTVRRDLEVLEQRGLLDKVHGGATLRRDGSTDEPGFQAKSVRELVEKDAIGRRAVELVEPGSAVAVTAGTTTYTLAHHLAQVPDITVVTNSIPVANVFFEARPRPDRAAHRRAAHGVRRARRPRRRRCPARPARRLALHGRPRHGHVGGLHDAEPHGGRHQPRDGRRGRAARRRCRPHEVGHGRALAHRAVARRERAVTDSGISSLAREALTDRIGEVVIAPLGAELRGTS